MKILFGFILGMFVGGIVYQLFFYPLSKEKHQNILNNSGCAVSRKVDDLCSPTILTRPFLWDSVTKTVGLDYLVNGSCDSIKDIENKYSVNVKIIGGDTINLKCFRGCDNFIKLGSKYSIDSVRCGENCLFVFIRYSCLTNPKQ